MRDPFLYAHQMGARLFSVGGKLYPISFRDQMLRGRFFVDRAVERGFLDPKKSPQYPLLIVGAGVAGISASIRALDHGLPVILVDKKDQALTVQENSRHRWISPTLYDFPVDHWRTDQFPWPPPAPPPPTLAWLADWAHKLVLAWRKALSDAMANQPTLISAKWTSKVDFAGVTIDPGGQFLNVPIVTTDPVTKGHHTTSHNVGLILLAAGFGEEKTYLRPPGGPKQPPSGFGFWEIDPYADPNCGLPANQKPQVLISGSGDGALQDFLRIVTGGKRTCDIYDHVPLSTDLLLTLQSAQERALRSFNWGCGPVHDHNGLELLHRTVERVVTTFLQAGGATLQHALDNVLHHPVPSIQLVHECTHFSACYGINQFLVLLIARHLEKQHGRNPVIMSERRISRITSSDGHVCNVTNPRGCHGRSHDISWVGLPDCRLAPTASNGSLSANVLIIRHGIDLQDYDPRDPTPPLARQVLPFSSA